MRFVLRADASEGIGAGHVMRILTLAEELVARRHEVIFVSAPTPLPWLRQRAERLGVRWIPCAIGEIDAEALLTLSPDAVVLDGYRFSPAHVAMLSRHLARTVAFVDGDLLGYEVALFVDQNLGAETSELAGHLGNRMLAGARYAMVRREIRVASLERSAWLSDHPASSRPLHVACLLGGTDPSGGMTSIVTMLGLVELQLRVTAISPAHQHPSLHALTLPRDIQLRTVEPSARLPSILACSDVAISASGTTAWDLLTMGVPTAFIKVAENQSAGYEAICAMKLGTCLGSLADIRANPAAVAGRLSHDWSSDELLLALSTRSRAEFDGLGAQRLANHLAGSQ